MKFRKKPVVIEAEQYFPGKSIEGVEVVGEEIFLSADRKYYYISRPKTMARHWLSVESIPGPVPEDKKNSGFFDKGMVEITLPSGEKYHRELMDFAIWSVSGKSIIEAADPESDIYKDYIASMGWPAEPVFYAYVKTVEGNVAVSPGDWIVQSNIKGEIYPCKPDIFEQNYEPVD